MTPASMCYANVLSAYKIEHDAYVDLKYQDEPDVPKINDRDNDRKVIK